MDAMALAELVPAIVMDIEGTYDFDQLGSATPDGGMFSLRIGDALILLMIQRPATLIITAGVAFDVDWSARLLAHINDLNAKLMVGRAFARRYDSEELGLDRGLVLLQD